MQRVTNPPIPVCSCLRSLLFAGSVLLGPFSGASAQQPELLPVPEVELVEGVEAGVEEVFPQLRETIDRLVANGSASNRQLAEAFGELGRAALYYEVSAVIEPALQNAQRLDPADYRWPYYLGAHYQDQRQLDEAITQLERAHQLRSEDPAINVRLGQLALLSDRPDRAPEYFEKARVSEGYSAVALYGLGRSASLRGDDAAATELFKAALEFEPEAVEIHQQLGLALRKLGDLDAARAHMSRQAAGSLTFPDPLMTSLKGDFARSHLFAGLEAQASGRWTDAVEEYSQAVELDPTSGFKHQALAGALEESGNLEAAIEEYRVAIELLPSDAMVRVLLARALVTKQGASDEAAEVFREAVELAPGLKEARIGLGSVLLLQEQHLEEASEHLNAALEIDPADLGARLQLARVMMLSGEAIEAVKELERILAVEPQRQEVLLNYGQALVRSGQPADASLTFEKLLAQKTTDVVKAVVHKELAEMAAAEGFDDQAMEHWQQAMDLAPELVPVGLGYAQALSAAGRYDEALAVYETVLMSNPQDGAVRLGQARALAAAGRLSEAKTQLETLLDTHPDLMEATLDLAAIQAREGEVNKAIDRLTRALEITEEADVKVLLNFEIGGLWQAAGDDQKAAESYGAAIEDFPEFKDAHFNMAISLGRLGRTEEALEHLRRVLEIDPEDEGAHLALAQAFAGQGLFAEARDTLEEGLRHAEGSPTLTSALVQLLIASPDTAVRDAVAAVPLALELHEENPSIQNAAMVAAALGAVGRHAEAADWQARVLGEAEAAGWPEQQLQRIRSDLELYRQRAGGD